MNELTINWTIFEQNFIAPKVIRHCGQSALFVLVYTAG